MLGFSFDYPSMDFEYQLKTKVHVIAQVKTSKLTLPKSTIYFDFDSAKLKKSEIPKLKVFIRGDRVVIKGYASPEGSEEYNLRLSERRAKSVKKYLERKGIQVEEVKAFGESLCFEEQKDWWKCRKVEVELK